MGTQKTGLLLLLLQVHGHHFWFLLYITYTATQPLLVTLQTDKNVYSSIITLAASSRKRYAMVWRPSVRLFRQRTLTVTHQRVAHDAASMHFHPSVTKTEILVTVVIIKVSNTSQGSVVTRLRCGGIINYCRTTNLLQNLPVKEFRKLCQSRCVLYA